jgi:ribosomal protein L40E
VAAAGPNGQSRFAGGLGSSAEGPVGASSHVASTNPTDAGAGSNAAGSGAIGPAAEHLPLPFAVSSGSLAELRRERLQLAERVASLTWDLGGLAYEMAIRDHYRLDVLARRAAELQQADAQLGEIERLLASDEGGVSGACRACGADHSRGAAYCWRCGSPLLREGRPSVVPPVAAPQGGVA